MGYQDSVNGTALTEAFLDENSKQVVMKYATAAARNADAALSAACREGMVSYQDDINSLIVQRDATLANISTIGPVHGALTTWTPTWTQSGTVTKTVNNGSSSRVGRQITAACLLTATGAGTAANAMTLTLPYTAAGTLGLAVGAGYFIDASTTFFYTGIAILQSTTTVALYGTRIDNQSSASSLMGSGASTFALAVASGDQMSVAIQYEAAADA